MKKAIIILIAVCMVLTGIAPVFAEDTASETESTEQTEKVSAESETTETENDNETTETESQDISVSLLYYNSNVNSGKTALTEDCEFEAGTGSLTLQVNYESAALQQDYAAGDIQITVYGLEKFGLTATSIAADGWNYTHHTGTYNSTENIVEDDYYIFTNKNAYTANTSLSGMFQLAYSIKMATNNCPYDGSSGTICAFLNSISSNELSFSFTDTKLPFTLNLYNSDYIYTNSSFGDDGADYYWSKAKVWSSVTTYSTKYMLYGTKVGAYYEVTLPSSCKLYAHYEGASSSPFQKIETVSTDGENSVYKIDWRTDYTNLFVGAPKDSYASTDIIPMEVSLYAAYLKKRGSNIYGDVAFRTSISSTLSLSKDLSDNEGDLYSFTNTRYTSKFTPTALTEGGEGWNKIALKLNKVDSTSFDVSVGIDFNYVLCTDGYEQLTDDEMRIRSILIPTIISDANNIPAEAGLYTIELYIREAGDSSYSLANTYTNSYSSTIWSPSKSQDIVGFYWKIYGVDQSFTSNVNNSSSAYFNVYKENANVQTNGYFKNSAFCIIENSETGEWVNPATINTYTDEEIAFGLPEKDIEQYGNYVYRKTATFPVDEDTFIGKVGFYTKSSTRNETENSTTYDLMFGIGQSGSTVSTINGANQYILLSKLLTVNCTTDEIIAATKKRWESEFAQSGNSLNKYTCASNWIVGESLQFETVDDYIDYLLSHMSIEIVHKYDSNDQTLIKVSWDFSDEPLCIKNAGFNAFGIDVPVTIYDTDILDYGGNITVTEYVEPILEDASYSSGGGSYSGTDMLGFNVCSLADLSADELDLNKNSDTTEKFYYITQSTNLVMAFDAEQEFSKLVDTDHSYWKVGASYVASDSDYSYRLRVRTASNGMTNLIMYDHIETYTPEGTESWQGTYTGIDLTRSEEQGYVPTVYYSLDSDAGRLSEDDSWVLYDDSVDLTTVKSLAFDYEDQTIQPNSVVSVDISMHSPEGDSNLYTYNRYGAEWQRVDAVTGYVFEDTESFDSNVTVVSLNEPIYDTETITVTSEWIGDDETTRPETQSFDLYQNDVLYGTYETSADDDWELSIVGLPTFDFDTGEEYTYTIDNPSAVTKYSTSVEDYIITNIYNSDLALVVRHSIEGYTKTVDKDFTFNLTADVETATAVYITADGEEGDEITISFTDGVGTFTMNPDEVQGIIIMLPSDTEYEVSIVPDDYYSSTSAQSGTLSDNADLAFTSSPKTNTLTTTITTQGTGANLDDEFTFRLTFSNDEFEYDPTIAYTKTGQSLVGVLETSGDNKTLELTVRNGDTISLDLYYGTVYSITETDGVTQGYAVSYTSGSGTITEDASAEVVNTKILALPTGVAGKSISALMVIGIAVLIICRILRMDRQM